MKTTKAQKAQLETKGTPPYIGFGRLINLLDRLHEVGTPTRIERNVLGGVMNGSDYSWMMSALKYLGLVDDQRAPTPTLARLAESTGDERKKLIQNLLESAYPFIFSPDAKFDLAKETDNTLLAKFEQTGTTSTVAKRCIVFFLNAAEYAGINVSPHIHVPRQRMTRERTPKTNPKPKGKTSKDKPPKQLPQDAHTPQTPLLTGEMAIIKDLADQLNKIPQDWTIEQRLQWANAIKDMIIVVRGEKKSGETTQ